DDPATEEPEPRIEREHVEGVVRHRARCDDRGDALAGAAEPAAKALAHVARERAGRDAREQRAPDPVGLDDPRVERILDPVRLRDQRQVRPGALEGSRPLRQAGVARPRVAVLEQRPGSVGAAEAARVRRVGVAREEKGAGASHLAHVAASTDGRRSAAHAIRPEPTTTSTVPPTPIAAPSITPERIAVTSAPKTSTAVTSTAWARASAANQVAT